MSLFKGHKKRDNKVSDAELHTVEHSVLGGRRILWAGLAAVLLPLAILLALQYWWLTELEHNSAVDLGDFSQSVAKFRNRTVTSTGQCNI